MDDVPPPNWSDEVGRADWISERLSPLGTTVTSLVPGGFEAYARILHPVHPRGDPTEIVRWHQVAAWSGLPLRADTQFHSIALPPRRPPGASPARGSGPRTGLHRTDGEAVARLLRTETGTPDACWFCIWDGYGWDNSYALVSPGDPPGGPRPDPVSRVVRTGPRVRLPGRDYLLYGGPVEAVTATLAIDADSTPNLWWPADRSWCVATDLYGEWTAVGGTGAMIDRLLAEPELETVPAGAGDPLFRVEPWVQQWIDEATDQVMATGEAQVITPLGTVGATLERPGRIRRGWLRTTTEADGSSGSGVQMIGRADDDAIRLTVSQSLTHEVLNLAGR